MSLKAATDVTTGSEFSGQHLIIKIGANYQWDIIPKWVFSDSKWLLALRQLDEPI